MNFVNRPQVELEEKELNLIEDVMELFGNIANEANEEGHSFATIEHEADNMVEYISDFVSLYIKTE